MGFTVVLVCFLLGYTCSTTGVRSACRGEVNCTAKQLPGVSAFLIETDGCWPASTLTSAQLSMASEEIILPLVLIKYENTYYLPGYRHCYTSDVENN